ncbi:50S ribosomal protein L4 [Gammaproteobacteria bacterium]|nr:50S ribosomal protein L4 [Gammaproteobacteria bacterium]
MKVSVFSHQDLSKQDLEIDLNESVFAKPFNRPLVWQVIRSFLAGGRQGSAQTKNRSAVSGGGKKPWRQKGTGRARAGTIRSPIFVGGGHTFSKNPTSFTQKVNKKMYAGALKSILSEHARRNNLMIIDQDLAYQSPNTKKLVLWAKHSGCSAMDKLFYLTMSVEENIRKSAGNVANFSVSQLHSLNLSKLYQANRLIISKDTVKEIEAWLM